MMEKKKNSKIPYYIFMFLTIVFICLYSINISGYSERINKSKTLFTEEQINIFEKDVRNGDAIDINKYTKEEDIDYSNKISDLGVEISKYIEIGSNKIIKWCNNFFQYLLN